MAKEETEEKVKNAVFDPAEFRVSAQDTKGHSTRCQFRTQPGHVTMTAAVVSSNHFAYRTKGDVYRHALARHLKYLETLAPIPSTTKQVDAILEIMRDEEAKKDLDDVISHLTKNVSDYMARSAEGEARRLVLKIKRHISEMPEGYWRDRHINELNDRFGYLLDNVERASLLKLSKED